MNTGLMLVLLTAIGFGTWPIVSRFSGANNAWIAVSVMSVTAVLAAVSHMTKLSHMPQSKGLAALLAASVLHAIGFIAFSKLVADPQFGTSSYVPAAMTSMIAVTVLGGVIVFQEPFNWSKGVGIAFSLMGAWLLTR